MNTPYNSFSNIQTIQQGNPTSDPYLYQDSRERMDKYIF